MRPAQRLRRRRRLSEMQLERLSQFDGVSTGAPVIGLAQPSRNTCVERSICMGPTSQKYFPLACGAARQRTEGPDSSIQACRSFAELGGAGATLASSIRLSFISSALALSALAKPVISPVPGSGGSSSSDASGQGGISFVQSVSTGVTPAMGTTAGGAEGPSRVAYKVCSRGGHKRNRSNSRKQR